MKKVFGEINLTWSKVIVMAIIMGIYTATMAMLPIAKNTSFSDLAVTFEVWIFFGIFIITNSKSPKDSALKCFVFFLISQPLVYLIQDLINKSQLFITYYRYWFMWTLATIPMGFIGYYMKKDKWWGLLILLPIMILLAEELGRYVTFTLYEFPRHLLSALFCAATLIIYPIAIFNNKKIKIIGTVISGVIVLAMIILSFATPLVYSTDILADGEEYQFDDTYKVYLIDSKYGDLKIRYEGAIECFMVHAEFKHAGQTEFVLEAPNGEKIKFDITIERDKYKVNKNGV